jgi:hypothetical protein
MRIKKNSRELEGQTVRLPNFFILILRIHPRDRTTLGMVRPR